MFFFNLFTVLYIKLFKELLWFVYIQEGLVCVHVFIPTLQKPHLSLLNAEIS